MIPSVQPDMAIADPTTLAKKKRVPIEPPNSKPSVRLIITMKTKREFKNLQDIKKTTYKSLRKLLFWGPTNITAWVTYKLFYR